MNIASQTANLVQEMAIALADHYIMLNHRPRFFSEEREGESTLFLKLCDFYEQKILKYTTSFDTILTNTLIEQSLRNTLDKIDEKYTNYEWHTWTSEDMLLALLQEFVRLFHEQEVGKESVEEINALPKAA